MIYIYAYIERRWEIPLRPSFSSSLPLPPFLPLPQAVSIGAWPRLSSIVRRWGVKCGSLSRTPNPRSVCLKTPTPPSSSVRYIRNIS